MSICAFPARIPSGAIPLVGTADEGYIVLPAGLHGSPGDAAVGVGVVDEVVALQFVLPCRITIQTLRIFVDTAEAGKVFGIGIYAILQKIGFTLSGGSGDYVITINGTDHTETFNTDLSTTAANLVININGGAEAARVTASSVGAVVTVISDVGGQNFSYASSATVGGVAEAAASDGALLFETGAKSTTSVGLQSIALGSPEAMASGAYFIAWTCDGTTARLRGISFGSDTTLNEMINENTAKRAGTIVEDLTFTSVPVLYGEA